MFNNKINEKILNKKFKKSIFSGYDPLDVDLFFDEVISYLKNNDNYIEQTKQSFFNLKKENLDLISKNSFLEQEIIKLKKQIAMYEAEGYSNVHFNRRIQNLEKERQKNN